MNPPEPVATRQRVILLLIGAAVMFTAVAISLFLGIRAAGVEVSGHGYFAFALGTALTLALSVGLFTLVFHSARSAHDQDADWRGPGG